MAFKEKNAIMKYRKWAMWKKGEAVIGKLVGFKEGNYNGTPTINFNLEVLEDVPFDDYKGGPIEVGDILSLARPKSLEDVVVEKDMGVVFRVEYNGKTTSASGTQYHTFKVAFDEEYEASSLSKEL